MEREPQDPKFYIDIGEHKLECTPENTFAYLYDDDKYDHVFIKTREDEEVMHGYHLFRHVIGDKFDALIIRMIQDGFMVNSEEEMTETDLNAYKRSLPDYYELKDPEEGWGNTKRDKAQKWGKFVAYLAEQIANGKQE